MKNIYFLLVFIAFLGLPVQHGFAQENPPVDTELNIEGLSVYPNPVSNNASTIYISSKNKLALKEIIIYNVLGKQIKAPVYTTKALDISSLNSGVYILKITEASISETRKLVVR